MLRCGPVIAGLCCVLLTACGILGQAQHRYTDLSHFGYVVANAFRATHPEYRVTHGNRAWEREPDEMAVELTIESNLVSHLDGVYVAVNFATRQDADSGRLFYTHSHSRDQVRLQDVFQQVETQTPGTSALTTALRRLGTDDARPKKDVDDQLKQTGRTKDVTVVVEWKEPMTADDIRSRTKTYPSNAVFSPATQGEPPVYWDQVLTPFCSGCDWSRDEVTDDFRLWVNRLEPSDDDALRHFGLGLARLRKVAGAGRIYGYVERDADPALLRTLLAEDYVKTMHLVRTRDHCEEVDDSHECVPAPWPEDDSRLYY